MAASAIPYANVKRNAYGPSSFVTAFSKNYDHHDTFTCPHAEKEWHEQALRLYSAIGETPSKRMVELINKDLDEVLRENGIRE